MIPGNKNSSWIMGFTLLWNGARINSFQEASHCYMCILALAAPFLIDHFEKAYFLLCSPWPSWKESQGQPSSNNNNKQWPDLTELCEVLKKYRSPIQRN
jgi:hypothetical protein